MNKWLIYIKVLKPLPEYMICFVQDICVPVYMYVCACIPTYMIGLNLITTPKMSVSFHRDNFISSVLQFLQSILHLEILEQCLLICIKIVKNLTILQVPHISISEIFIEYLTMSTLDDSSNKVIVQIQVFQIPSPLH